MSCLNRLTLQCAFHHLRARKPRKYAVDADAVRSPLDREGNGSDDPTVFATAARPS